MPSQVLLTHLSTLRQLENYENSDNQQLKFDRNHADKLEEDLDVYNRNKIIKKCKKLSLNVSFTKSTIQFYKAK